jgi:hypothetical protein
MTSHDTPTIREQQAGDGERQLQQIADLVDEYAALAEPTGNADLLILLFQIRVVLGDDPAQAGQRISRSRQTPA